MNKILNFKNNGQVFIIDLITASVLAVLTFGIFFTYYYFADPPESLYNDVFELSDAMATIKINDLNNDFVRDLFIAQKITDIDNTILQQISDFYMKGNLADAQNLTSELTKLYVTKKVGFQITLNNGTSSLILDSSNRFGSKDDARVIVNLEKRIVGFSDSNPYIHTYEFEVWRR